MLHCKRGPKSARRVDRFGLPALFDRRWLDCPGIGCRYMPTRNTTQATLVNGRCNRKTHSKWADGSEIRVSGRSRVDALRSSLTTLSHCAQLNQTDSLAGEALLYSQLSAVGIDEHSETIHICKRTKRIMCLIAVYPMTHPGWINPSSPIPSFRRSFPCPFWESQRRTNAQSPVGTRGQGQLRGKNFERCWRDDDYDLAGHYVTKSFVSNW